MAPPRGVKEHVGIADQIDVDLRDVGVTASDTPPPNRGWPRLRRLSPALYADDSHESSGSTRKDGMMGRGHMMGRTSRMMEGCGTMMQGGRSDRPNDQWRKAPAQPGKDG